LFTDPSLPDEYDAAAAELLWIRVLGFLDDLARQPVRAAEPTVPARR
jgi:hypothetical protein